jgi:hypothetical protein
MLPFACINRSTSRPIAPGSPKDLICTTNFGSLLLRTPPASIQFLIVVQADLRREGCDVIRIDVQLTSRTVVLAFFVCRSRSRSRSRLPELHRSSSIVPTRLRRCVNGEQRGRQPRAWVRVADTRRSESSRGWASSFVLGRTPVIQAAEPGLEACAVNWPPSGADLTLATRLPGFLYANVKPKHSQKCLPRWDAKC